MKSSGWVRARSSVSRSEVADHVAPHLEHVGHGGEVHHAVDEPAVVGSVRVTQIAVIAA